MTETAKDQQPNEKVDRFGMVASSLCAIHCAICSLAPAIFGAIGLGFLLSIILKTHLHWVQLFLHYMAVFLDGGIIAQRA